MGRPYGRYRDEGSRNGLRGGLAPDDQAEKPAADQVGPGLDAADPGLCFFLISPGGASDVAPASAVAPEQGALRGADAAQLVERWVRRISLGGDSRRGVARLDIGGGRYAGAELVVVAESSHVSVKLSLNGAAGDDGLAKRLRSGLEARGYAVDIDVD